VRARAVTINTGTSARAEVGQNIALSLEFTGRGTRLKHAGWRTW